MEAGEQITVTEVIVGGTFTVTVALPDFVESCVDVAVIIALPVPVGVKTPAEVIVPPVAVQFTPELYAPVPVTVDVHVEVCVVRMDVGEQTTVTDVIVGGRTTVTDAEPDLVESSVDVAVIVAFPAPEGVKTPTEEAVPPVADHVTAEL